MKPEMLERWNALSAAGRALLGLALLALAAATAGAAWWALRDDQQVLFSGLSQPDAAAVVKELDRLKVPYRLAGDGGTVLVAQDDVYRTRLKLMGTGGLALQGTVGFEMFNNTDFGMTDFAQRINYQRAMQGELSRTILGLAEVASARVHLVLPENGLFKKGQAKPKASVTLGLKGALKPAQILSVQRLVAAAVPEMEPDAVTVVDQKGETLSRPQGGDADEPTGAPGRLEAKQQAEAYVRRKVAEVLDRALGAGRAIVTVDVVLNADRVQYTKEELLPFATANGQAVGATVKRRESVQSQQPGSPMDPRPAKAGDAGLSAESTGHTVEVEYANGRKVEQVVLGSGQVRRLSVGVLVPANVAPAELATLREMVAMAVGLSESRGDAIAIHTIDAPAAVTATATVADAGSAPVAVASQALPPQASMPVPSTWAWPVAFAVIGVLVAGFLLLWRRAAPDEPPPLSEAQRAALLDDIRRWSMEGPGGRPSTATGS